MRVKITRAHLFLVILSLPICMAFTIPFLDYIIHGVPNDSAYCPLYRIDIIHALILLNPYSLELSFVYVIQRDEKPRIKFPLNSPYTQ